MMPAQQDHSAGHEDLASRILDPEFWRAFAPNMTVGNKPDGYIFELPEDILMEHRDQLIREGYTHLHAPGLKGPLDEMPALFDALAEIGLPSVFCFMYDQTWMLSNQLRGMLGNFLHDKFVMMPDFWAWRVTPGQTGWEPHRDKKAYALFPDKTPKSLTVWLPVTQARPRNGCMYVLPADRDPNYGTDVETGYEAVLTEIRALPADPGDVLVWTQHVLHWGSRSAPEHDLPPRMSIAFEYQRSDVEAFNQPLLNPRAIPVFNVRLALIAKQILQYRHMYKFSDELVAMAEAMMTHYKTHGRGE